MMRRSARISDIYFNVLTCSFIIYDTCCSVIEREGMLMIIFLPFLL